MTTEARRQARQAWAHAHMDLDTCLTKIIPAALANDLQGEEELQRLLTDDLTHEIARLYGTTVGYWTPVSRPTGAGERDHLPLPTQHGGDRPPAPNISA